MGSLPCSVRPPPSTTCWRPSPSYDLATMDTITLIRSAVRRLSAAADVDLSIELRAGLASGNDYTTASKPQIDSDDVAVRAALIDSRARDGRALLKTVGNRTVAGAAVPLATVLSHDLEDREAVCSGLPAGSPRTGSSPPSTPKPAIGTRPTARATTGSKATSGSTCTAKSSSRPRSAHRGIKDALTAVDPIANVLTDPYDVSAATTDRAVDRRAAYAGRESLDHLDHACGRAESEGKPDPVAIGHYTVFLQRPLRAQPGLEAECRDTQPKAERGVKHVLRHRGPRRSDTPQCKMTNDLQLLATRPRLSPDWSPRPDSPSATGWQPTDTGRSTTPPTRSPQTPRTHTTDQPPRLASEWQ